MLQDPTPIAQKAQEAVVEILPPEMGYIILLLTATDIGSSVEMTSNIDPEDTIKYLESQVNELRKVFKKPKAHHLRN